MEETFRALIPECVSAECKENTPRRAASAWCELLQGYTNKFPDIPTFDALTGIKVDVDDITVRSMCEHHLLPFLGKASVEYTTNKHIIGRSEIQRIIEYFSQRLQLQGRLTAEIANSICYYVDADVTVNLKCVHTCCGDLRIETTFTAKKK